MAGAKFFFCVCISDVYSIVYSYLSFKDVSYGILYEKFNSYTFVRKTISVPVGAPVVYRDTEDDPETTNLGGGLAEELADDGLDPLISLLVACYLAGMCHGSAATLILSPRLVLYQYIYCVKFSV